MQSEPRDNEQRIKDLEAENIKLKSLIISISVYFKDSSSTLIPNESGIPDKIRQLAKEISLEQEVI